MDKTYITYYKMFNNDYILTILFILFVLIIYTKNIIQII